MSRLDHLLLIEVDLLLLDIDLPVQKAHFLLHDLNLLMHLIKF